MLCLKIVEIEGGLGFVLPPELLEQMKLAAGDRLLVTQTPTGWVMNPVDIDSARQIELANDAAQRYRDVLRNLADS
jgi:putative addiction module antidote